MLPKHAVAPSAPHPVYSGTTALRRLRMDSQAVPILDLEDGQPIITREGEKSDEHSIMTVPLRAILKPGDSPTEPLKKTETGPPEPFVYFAYGSNMSTAGCESECRAASRSALLPCRVMRFAFMSAAGTSRGSATHLPVATTIG